MNDLGLFTCLERALGPVFSQYPRVRFLRTKQGRATPARSVPTVIANKIYDRPRGCPERRWDARARRHIESQQLETSVQMTFEVDVQTASDSAADVAAYCRAELLSSRADDVFRLAGAGRFLVGQVNDIGWISDREEYAERPSFDVVITHFRTLIFGAPAARIARPKGIFPI